MGTNSVMRMPLYSHRRRQRALTSHWRSFGIALAAGGALGALVLLFVPWAAGLFLFGIYSIPSNSMVPVPHEPGLLYFAKYYHPFGIALAGTLGTAVAAFADYELVERALRHPRMRDTRDTRIYRFALRWLMARPFITVVLFAATPLPIYVVRILAPASGYPVGRYIAALMVGRFPRFYVVAWLGYIFPIPTWILILMFVALVASVAIGLRGPSHDEGAEAD